MFDQPHITPNIKPPPPQIDENNTQCLPSATSGSFPLETRDAIYEHVLAFSHNAFRAEDDVPAFCLGQTSSAIKAEVIKTMNRLSVPRNTRVFKTAICLHNTQFMSGWRFPSTLAKNVVFILETTLPKKIKKTPERVVTPFDDVVRCCYRWKETESLVVETRRPERDGFPAFLYGHRPGERDFGSVAVGWIGDTLEEMGGLREFEVRVEELRGGRGSARARREVRNAAGLLRPAYHWAY